MSIYEDDPPYPPYTPILVDHGRNRVGDRVYLLPPASRGRPRAASQGGQAQPINLIVNAPSERSHSRSYSRSRHSPKYSDEYSSDDSRHTKRSREPRRRSRHGPEDIDNLPYQVRKQLEEAQKIKEAEKEKERAAAAELERKRWEADWKEREKEEKRRKERILEEARQDEARKKREQEELRKKFIEEEEERKRQAKKRKEEEEELRKRIIKEEEEKKQLAKKKKEEEEKEFEAKFRKKFKDAGYSDERIDRVLHGRRESRDESDRAWAIDLSRPTFIKVNRKHLSPDTLDYYNLPWEWDKKNTEYIIIKKYIDDDFQDVLFEHTRSLKLRETKVLTSGYEKDVTVRLKPATGVVKNKDQMYLVREKSKSPARSVSRSRRSSWMFT